MSERRADVVVVGAGIAGMLVARELAAAGREVLILERGRLKPHAEQLADGTHERDDVTAVHNDEAPPGEGGGRWDYVYGVGGSTLHWAGTATRLLPSDFELRSRFGVGADWPLGYDDLVPYWEEAERVMGVAGGPNVMLRGTERLPQPPHPFSPVDRLVSPLLAPYASLPQARPTLSVDGRPPCCGSARCGLCPVDARFSALHVWDRELRDRDEIELVEGTVASRLRTAAGAITGVECVDAVRARMTLRARTVVLAANGIENAALLLRSQLGGDDVGRRLFDHPQRLLEFPIERHARHGLGASLSTGISYAFADGPWRSERASMLVYPYNPGRSLPSIRENVIDRLLDHHSDAASAVRERFERTLVLVLTGEDVPSPERRVRLSANKDGLGLPLNRIEYPPNSPYYVQGFRHAVDELVARLAPLGAKRPREAGSLVRAHMLGTCPFGRVVDTDLRVRGVRGLFAAGGSAFPSYAAAWPTLTIAALAIRLGRALARG